MRRAGLSLQGVFRADYLNIGSLHYGSSDCNAAQPWHLNESRG